MPYPAPQNRQGSDAAEPQIRGIIFPLLLDDEEASTETTQRAVSQDAGQVLTY